MTQQSSGNGKTEKSPKSQEFDYDAWARRFYAEVQKDAYARKSWNTLLQANREIEAIAPPLLCFASDVPQLASLELLSAIRSDMLTRAKEMRRIAGRLRAESSAVTTLKLDPPDHRATKRMEALAARLEVSSKRLKQEVSLRTFNTGSFVFLLIRMLHESTQRHFYREVSYLLQPAYLAHGTEPPETTEESLRKAYKRFERSPELEELWRSGLKRTLFTLIGVAAVVHVLSLAKPNTATSPDAKTKES